jgi:photosystem II stability/assembly factor-like uncharacterized protein
MKNQYLLLFALIFTFSANAQKKKKDVQLPLSQSVTQSLSQTLATDRFKALEVRKSLEAKSLVNNIKFRSIGPTVMSGRVVDVDVNNQNPTQFYVAYASGGLWKTENNGISFSPLFDNEAVMTIGDVAVDWKTNSKTIWVGTGEANSSRSSYAGVGMYKSEDGGKTWQHKGLAETHHIGKVILHPTDPNTVWVAALGRLYSPNKERGIYKTTDGGKTWKQTLFVDENTGGVDLSIDPSNPQTLYAGMWHKTRSAYNFVESGKTTGVYKSTNGGENWALITGEGSGFPQGDGNGRVGVGISPQNPNIVYVILDNQKNRPDDGKKKEEDNVLTAKKLRTMNSEQFLALSDNQISEYLDEKRFPEKYTAKSLKADVKSGKIQVLDIVKFTENANDDLFDTPITGAEVYRSDDAGKSWKRTHKDYLDWVFNTYGYYFGTVFVAPDNADKIVIPGFQIIKSEDGGKTFQSMNADNAHADHHIVWINPTNSKHQILGNDGGINITYDDGKTWFKANTPAVGQFYAVQVDMAKPYNVYGGLQDNGVWFGPSTNKPDFDWYDSGQYPFKRIMGGDGMQIAVDTRDNQTVYTGFQFGNYFRLNTANGSQKYLQMPQEVGEIKNRFNWQSPILLSRHNQDVVYFGGNRFFRSLDKGETWKALSGDLTKGGKEGDVPFGTLTTIDESPLKFGLLYVGTDDGFIHISKDGGYTWAKISDGLPQNLWVSRVNASNHTEGTVYASLNGYRDDHFNSYVYRSTDYGITWQKIGEDLPAEPVNVVKEDPKNSNLLYVGTDHSLYISVNQGKTFMRMSGDMPSVPVHDLLVHSRDNELVVGTHGRSIYIADVSLVQQLTDSLMNKDLHLFAMKPINLNARWGKVDAMRKYDEPEKREQSISYFTKNTGKTKVSITTDKGLVLKEMTDDSEVGINIVNWDYTINPTAAKDYEKYLNDTKKKDDKAIKVEEGEDHLFYAKAGKYKIIFETANGIKSEQNFEIKAPERRSRRMAIPSVISSPGEFEEWMEESGLEGKK